MNLYYRSLKNQLGGRILEGQLDASESITWFLDFLFAAHGRVRPFNKWLRWEFANCPLEVEWRDVLESVGIILSTAETGEQNRLFGKVEPFARRLGLGDEIDSWGPDAALLPGGASPETRSP